MKKIIFALLWCYAIQAQTFDFSCTAYTLPSDYSHITLDTNPYEFFKLFNDDLEATTGNRNTILDRPLTTTYQTPGKEGWAHYIGYPHIILEEIGPIAVTSKGCIDSEVLITIRTSFWENAQINQRLWVMYHELGHDVLGLEHNNNHGDIMQKGNSGVRDLSIEFFIEKKNLMFNDINQIYTDCN